MTSIAFCLRAAIEFYKTPVNEKAFQFLEPRYTPPQKKKLMSCTLCNTADHVGGDGEILWVLLASYSESLMEANYIVLSKVTVSL